MRDSTIFYRSFYEAISELDPNTKAKIYDAIFEYSLNFKMVELEGVAKTIFTLIKPQIDANIKRYINGTQPKDKQKGSETEAEDKQDAINEEANKNVNDNANVNLNENEKVEIVSYLNSVLGTKYDYRTNKTSKAINARLKEGYSVADFKSVIDDKFAKWGNDEKMKDYLRPETLFGGKFESYLNTIKVIEPKKEGFGNQWD